MQASEAGRVSAEELQSEAEREARLDRCVHFRFLGSVFVGRDRTIGVFAYTEERLGGSFWSEGGPEEIDLKGVTEVSSSFAREYFGTLAAIAAENGQQPPTILNASDDVRATIEWALRLRRVQCEFAEADRTIDPELVRPHRGW